MITNFKSSHFSTTTAILMTRSVTSETSATLSSTAPRPPTSTSLTLKSSWTVATTSSAGPWSSTPVLMTTAGLTTLTPRRPATLVAVSSAELSEFCRKLFKVICLTMFLGKLWLFLIWTRLDLRPKFDFVWHLYSFTFLNQFRLLNLLYFQTGQLKIKQH